MNKAPITKSHAVSGTFEVQTNKNNRILVEIINNKDLSANFKFLEDL